MVSSKLPHVFCVLKDAEEKKRHDISLTPGSSLVKLSIYDLHNGKRKKEDGVGDQLKDFSPGAAYWRNEERGRRKEFSRHGYPFLKRLDMPMLFRLRWANDERRERPPRPARLFPEEL